MRQALSREFDKLDSYWLGGKTDQEIQTDAEGGPMELKESPYETPQQGPAVAGPRLPDYTVFAAPVLKQMLKELTAQLMDTPVPRAGQVLDQIEMIAVTLRAKLHEAAEARRQKGISSAQV